MTFSETSTEEEFAFPKKKREERISCPGGIEIIWNGRLYVIQKEKQTIAYCFDLDEAQKYAEEYQIFSEGGIPSEEEPEPEAEASL